jgi:hypothetical protein
MRPIPEVKPLPREQTMLSFEVIESGKAIQICADDEGLRVLRKALVIRRFKRGWTNFLECLSAAGGSLGNI